MAVLRTSGRVTSYTVDTTFGAAKGMNRAVKASITMNRPWLAIGTLSVTYSRIAPISTAIGRDDRPAARRALEQPVAGRPTQRVAEGQHQDGHASW